MMAEQRAGFCPPLHHTEEPVGDPRLLVDLRQDDSGHGRQGRRLEDHGVTWTPAQRRFTPTGGGSVSNPAISQLTTCQSWSRLPRCHLEGIIPGPDSRAHAERLPAGVGKRPPGELDVLALEEGNTWWLRATRHEFKTGKHHMAPSPASAPARPA